MDLPVLDINSIPESPLAAGHLNHNDLPWVDQGMGIGFKILRVCNQTGSWVTMNRFPPGTLLPKHRHSGAVTAFTLQGRWGYQEHDFLATEGSVIREPANSAHTLIVPESTDEDAVVFFCIDGSLTNFGEDGSVWGIADGHSQLADYLRLAEEQGLSVDASLILA
ncbi:hypothetical protein EOPP23_14655 [Endozoicomonas sp. OPT23]|uniref:2,4'-dihydroxyacetophenone dioxygenase family protein n=1 Tax=Endozoicomonas sp. OPT23 TaxID=2072845 RepID=UPI00129B12B6|nr:2,4'-dihydroxyacetophenone dioxygenase family protein [Endozoicomonas sp. OPT23]MRI34232.1 hypothetical protein [Endozoicomonas sp. OPT23]